MSQSRGRSSAALAVILAACVSLGATACASGSGSASGSPGLPVSNDPALDAGRVLVESKCDLCHTLDRIKIANKDSGGWTTTVARMRKNGAVISDQEAQQIIDYLVSR